MRINISGEFLDLYDTELSFERKNSLFDLKKSYADSTYNFDVPATKKNNRIFQNANVLAGNGNGARKYYNAQLQMDGYSENGRFYIVSSTPDVYKCCMLIGNSVRFKDVFEDSKLADLFTEEDGYIINDGTNKNGVGLAANVMRFAKYDNGQPYQFPYVRMSEILDRINTKIPLLYVPEDAKYVGLIANDYRRPQGINCHFGWHEEAMAGGEFDVLKLEGNSLFFDFQKTATIWGDYYFTGGIYGYGTREYGYLTKQDTEIKLPEDFPGDCFIIALQLDKESSETAHFATPPDGLYQKMHPEIFAGEYYFDIRKGSGFGRPYGVPLAGRTVSIKAGMLFQFVKAGKQGGQDTIEFYTNDNRPIGNITAAGFSMELQVSFVGTTMAKNEFTEDRLYLKDWLPDMYVINFLQSVANMYGRALKLSKNSVQFVQRINQLFPYDASGDLYSTGESTRQVEGYAQRNRVTYSTDEINEKNAVTYVLRNETLEEEKDIAEIPYNNGRQKSDNTLRLDDLEYKEEEKDGVTTVSIKSNTKHFAVAFYGDEEEEFETLNYIGALKQNLIISKLTKESTRTTANVRMTAAKMLQIDEGTLVVINGVRYMWRTIKWANGTATFDLQKY